MHGNKQENPRYNRPSYERWEAMKQRCLNENHPKYVSYGGRGIRICTKWLNYDGFLDDMGEPSTGMQIDRKDNNGNYELENCRWASRKMQQNNTRANHIIEFAGSSLTLQQWGEFLHIKPNTILTRLRRGWGTQAAFEIGEKHED